MLASGRISDRQRITRHLWRMCFGLFIATGSFFLGQQAVFPRFPARLHLPDSPCPPAIPLDDLLALPRPLLQGLQDPAIIHSRCRVSLKSCATVSTLPGGQLRFMRAPERTALARVRHPQEVTCLAVTEISRTTAGSCYVLLTVKSN
jgi:hypothetical protein